MSAPIRNADARRFWEARYAYWTSQFSPGQHNVAAKFACQDLDVWATCFADADTLADIEANKARRGGG